MLWCLHRLMWGIMIFGNSSCRSWCWGQFFGTPCNTFSAARKEDGGPPPLRSMDAPWGLPNLSPENQALVFLGNLFLLRTIEAATIIFLMGGNFSIENPLHSLLWHVPAFIRLAVVARLFMVDFEQCNFGAPSKKPTRLAVTHEIFSDLAGSCRAQIFQSTLVLFDPCLIRVFFFLQIRVFFFYK